jgi:hypothetical protein
MSKGAGRGLIALRLPAPAREDLGTGSDSPIGVCSATPWPPIALTEGRRTERSAKESCEHQAGEKGHLEFGEGKKDRKARHVKTPENATDRNSGV